MMFTEIEPNEKFDLRRFQSLPSGRWEAGIIKMLWGKARVRIALAQSDGWIPIDYWGGDHETAFLLCDLLIGLCMLLPEAITERELCKILPEQNDKELGPDFWNTLFKAGDEARATYGAFQE
jgi:hypothetical protein